MKRPKVGVQGQDPGDGLTRVAVLDRYLSSPCRCTDPWPLRSAPAAARGSTGAGKSPSPDFQMPEAGPDQAGGQILEKTAVTKGPGQDVADHTQGVRPGEIESCFSMVQFSSPASPGPWLFPAILPAPWEPRVYPGPSFPTPAEPPFHPGTLIGPAPSMGVELRISRIFSSISALKSSRSRIRSGLMAK